VLKKRRVLCYCAETLCIPLFFKITSGWKADTCYTYTIQYNNTP